MEIHYFVVLLFGVFSSTVGTTATGLNLEETVTYLKQRTEELEGRVASLESRGTGDLVQRMDEVLKRVTEVESRCEELTPNVEEKIRNSENKYKKIHNHLLMEALQFKPMLKQAVEKVRSVEEELMGALGRERLKTHSLQVQMAELNSELHTVDLVRKNISSMADNLKLQLNNDLTFGLENIQSNLTRNMRIFGNSSLKFSKDCANFSYVSKLDEHLKNLEESSKKELGTLRSELSPRLEKLEERSDDVSELKKALTNLSTQLISLNRHLRDVENACVGEPPSLRNGKPLKFDRKPKSIVQYECDWDFVMTGNSTVTCEYGRWEGQPPNCSFFDTTFTLVARRGNITCYSDRHFEKIAFSRVLDTGSGGGLPRRATTRREEGAAVLDMSAIPGKETDGTYECGFRAENRSVGIVVPSYFHFGDVRFDHASQVANIGDTVQLVVTIYGSVNLSKLRWRRNGVHVPSWAGQKIVEIVGAQPDDSGIYECYRDGQRSRHQALLRLIVIKCGKNRYGVNCEQECPVCYNGGICHDIHGVCVCPSGFTGKNCEYACGANHLSADCRKLCTGSVCEGNFFCKSDPYGCSCFPGFRGLACDRQCDPGWYGANCKQPCHCAYGGESCNIYTGACSGGCSPEWSGESCQIEE